MSEAKQRPLDISDLFPYFMRSAVCKIYTDCEPWSIGEKLDEEIALTHDIFIGRINTLQLRNAPDNIKRGGKKIATTIRVLDIQLHWITRMRFRTRADFKLEPCSVDGCVRKFYSITVFIPPKNEWVNGENIQLVGDNGDLVVISLAPKDLAKAEAVYGEIRSRLLLKQPQA